MRLRTVAQTLLVLLAALPPCSPHRRSNGGPLPPLPSLIPPLDREVLASWVVGGTATALRRSIALLGAARGADGQRQRARRSQQQPTDRGYALLHRDVALGRDGWVADVALKMPRQREGRRGPRLALLVQRQGSALWASTPSSFAHWLKTESDPIEAALEYNDARVGAFGAVVALHGRDVIVAPSSPASSSSSSSVEAATAAPGDEERRRGAHDDVWVRVVRRRERLVVDVAVRDSAAIGARWNWTRCVDIATRAAEEVHDDEKRSTAPSDDGDDRFLIALVATEPRHRHVAPTRVRLSAFTLERIDQRTRHDSYFTVQPLRAPYASSSSRWFVGGDAVRREPKRTHGGAVVLVEGGRSGGIWGNNAAR